MEQAGSCNCLLSHHLEPHATSLTGYFGRQDTEYDGHAPAFATCREAWQADPGWEICSQHLFSSGSFGSVIRNNDQPSC